MERRASMLDKVDQAMPEIEKAVAEYALGTYDHKALQLILSGKAREAFNLDAEKKELRDKYGRHTFGQSLLMARRLIEAGSRVVQVNWPAVANGNPGVDAWDTHSDNFPPLKNIHCPKLDSGLPTLIQDLDDRGLLKDTIVLAIGEFGRSPKMGVSTSGNTNGARGRDHWPYCYTGLMAGGPASCPRQLSTGQERQDRLQPADKSSPSDLSCWRRSITQWASTQQRWY